MTLSFQSNPSPTKTGCPGKAVRRPRPRSRARVASAASESSAPSSSSVRTLPEGLVGRDTQIEATSGTSSRPPGAGVLEQAAGQHLDVGAPRHQHALAQADVVVADVLGESGRRMRRGGPSTDSPASRLKSVKKALAAAGECHVALAERPAVTIRERGGDRSPEAPVTRRAAYEAAESPVLRGSAAISARRRAYTASTAGMRAGLPPPACARRDRRGRICISSRAPVGRTKRRANRSWSHVSGARRCAAAAPLDSACHARVQAIIFDLDTPFGKSVPVIVRAEHGSRVPRERYRVARADTLRLNARLRARIAVEHPASATTSPGCGASRCAGSRGEAGYAEEMAEEAFDVFFRARNEVELYDDVCRRSSASATLPGCSLRAMATPTRRESGSRVLRARLARRRREAEAELRASSVLLGRAGLAPSGAHVGDDVEADVEGARRAGSRQCG